MEEVSTVDIQKLGNALKRGELSGVDLREMEVSGQISKSERRKIVKVSKQAEPTPRQLVRIATKEKKKLPKLSKDDRLQKFTSEMDKSREKEEANFIICLNCRKRGHFLKDCPKANDSKEICFNCGSEDHPLRHCPEPQTGFLQYAKCFVCQNLGHLSKDCPKNSHGLYPKGGCCHICLLKTHLVKDCPQRTEEDIENAKKRRAQKEDEELGPRVAGLLEGEEGLEKGGDFVSFEGSTGVEEGEEEEPTQKKPEKKNKKFKKGK